MSYTFEQWMEQVEVACVRLSGVGTADLVDYAYAEAFEGGVGPYSAARAAIRANDQDD